MDNLARIAPPPPTEIAPRLAELAELAELAASLAAEDLRPNTRRAYAAAWQAWVRWTEDHGIPSTLPAPPMAVVAWVTDSHRAGLALATIKVRLAALRTAHKDLGLEPPESRELHKVLGGIAEAQAGRGRREKRPLSPSMVAAALPSLSTRDRAIALVGMATGCRRAELAAMQWSDVRAVATGLVIKLGKRKCGPDGQLVGVPRGRGLACPVAALRDLRREQGNPADGPVFGCTCRTIANTIKRIAELAGEDSRDFAGHSLRAGLMTTAADAGAPMFAAMSQGGWSSVDVAAVYYRESEAASNPAARAVVAELASAGGAL